ncbi:dihydroorotase [Paenibacillus eucommiae]|uniref:Dihydroorotase n=1 Tax=Paenibacillus eucommiae TaxID=1355755 RepID=A0ABS4J0B8_9BACL|nr:dihydroorotase [Paenibacillus eucommiae]MBP1992770.1 dihydroorotase [Paenibacillus eucommiae]
MGIWILNGFTVDADNEQTQRHICIEDGIIIQVINGGEAPDTAGHTVIDAAGKLVSPGFIDMHVHLREPGFEHKETIATGTLSAARGGFTTIACMPNTRPVIDTVDTVKLILDKAETEGAVRVLPYGCITKNELGRELTDFAALKEAGVIGYTDDGVGVQSAQMMKDAMNLAASLGMPIIAHCEDNTLVEGAPVTEGEFARKHGLKGIPNESEAIHVGRDVLLAEATGVHYHVCHVSTEQSVRLIRHAKQHGIKVTAEVCPHHLVLSDEDIPDLDANWKMNPPLRTPRDVQAVIEGLEDGTIDIIVTDHAPHAEEEKAKGMMLAPFGILGFETAFPLLYTKFVLTGQWTLGFLVDRLTAKPAEVFSLPWGKLEVGSPADITIVDLASEQEIKKSEIVSKSKNTPFIGWKLQGWPVVTIASGKVVWS